MSECALGDEGLLMASEDNGICEIKGFCKQRLSVGFWWLKEKVTVSERILCSSRHISIPIM